MGLAWTANHQITSSPSCSHFSIMWTFTFPDLKSHALCDDDVEMMDVDYDGDAIMYEVDGEAIMYEDDFLEEFEDPMEIDGEHE
eukprot:CAMPEP_0178932160 /NCGR_PEP_ID=MMETSP0786-20121207/22421_1 /TAXON_ID=186022 /ORGANISM="Thalassionema frauenfeldii, Strain CCMP 1798" /LENGTH=83 /DNA_ID=CAMNT_0020609337 /DNA_START=179 /DNA_END=427 /DNA_ORIENTATION=-